jgi:hypothetical protein
MDLTKNSELGSLNLGPLILYALIWDTPVHWVTTLLSRLKSSHIEEIGMHIWSIGFGDVEDRLGADGRHSYPTTVCPITTVDVLGLGTRGCRANELHSIH